MPTISALLLPELENEFRITRTVLERVPDDRGEWKPHEKSFPMGHLAQLVARMPGWTAMVMQQTELDIAPVDGPKTAGYSIEKTATLLAEFDKNVASARQALEEVTGSALDEPWSLKMGEQVLMTSPRGETVRQHLNHLIHHRGQLTVYLRLVDVPLPQVYGPTADERW